MSVIRRHYKRRMSRAWWALLAVACVWAAVPVSVLKWPVAVLAFLGLVVTPVVVKGVGATVSDAFTPRRRRIEQRKDFPRPAVPVWLRRVIYSADRYRCVYCHRKPGTQPDGSRVKLQLDHYVPWSLGGLTSLWNSFTLCDRHNLVKSSYWKSDSGKIYYRPFRQAANLDQAGKIARAEIRARCNPLRWLRAGRSWWLRKVR